MRVEAVIGWPLETRMNNEKPWMEIQICQQVMEPDRWEWGQ